MGDVDLKEIMAQQLLEEKINRMRVSVELPQYSEAVMALVKLAQGDTGGSMAAAQVLLSLYNGINWHMDLTDFGRLDYSYFRQALVATQGRHTLHHEPHSVIANGASIFSCLENQWKVLHTRIRYQKYCG